MRASSASVWTRSRTPRLAALTVIAATALAVGACSAPSDGTSSGAASQVGRTTYANVQDSDLRPPAPEVEGATKGGTITVLTESVPHTFDPTRAYYLDVLSIMKLVTRGLTQVRYVDGKPVLVPDLATDLGRPSDNFKRWEFTLRDAVKYEDGSPVRVDDIAHAIKRQLALDELPDGPTYGLDYYLDGNTYEGPWTSGPNFAAVETPDDKTLVLKMRKPFPSMQYYASFPTFTPIPESKDTKQDYGNHPLATGPYKFESYDPGNELVLERNPEWDPETDPSRKQYVDNWVFEFGMDPSTIQQQVIADSEPDQHSVVPDSILAENIQAVESDPQVEERFVLGPSPCVYYLWMDTRKLSPVQVRRAVALAWPYEQSNKVAGSVQGLTWRPGTSLMPSVTPGWLNYDAVGNGGKGTGDPKAARKLLKSVNALGVELSYHYAEDDPIQQKLSEVWRQQLEKAGFTVKPIPVPDASVRALANDPKSPVNLRRSGWCIDWANADSVFPAVLDGRKADDPGVPNPSFLNVDEVNKEMDRILRLPAKDAIDDWGKLDKMIMEKYLPAVNLGEDATTLLRGSKVGNMRVDTMLSAPDYTQMYAIP